METIQIIARAFSQFRILLQHYCLTFTHGSTTLFTSLTVCKYVDGCIQNTKSQLTWSDTACCSSNHNLSREAPARLLGESGTPPRSGGVRPYPCCPRGVPSWLDPSPWIGHLGWKPKGSGRDLDGQRGGGTCSETGRGCGGLLDPAVKRNGSKNLECQSVCEKKSNKYQMPECASNALKVWKWGFVKRKKSGIRLKSELSHPRRIQITL